MRKKVYNDMKNITKYMALSTADMATAVGGSQVSGLNVPTGDLLVALRNEIVNRRREAKKLTASYPAMVSPRASLAVLLNEIHHGAAA